MNENTRRLLYWTPRILCIVFAAFLSIFALDVFDMPVDFRHKMLALLIHLIPSGLVLAALIIVWRREWIGAVIFPLLALLHLVGMRGRLDWTGYVGIEGPLVLLGILFGLNWRSRATRRPGMR